MNEEKIIKILEDNFTDSIEFDREKCKDELLILFNVSQQRELLAFVKEVAEWDKDYSSTNIKLKAKELLKAIKS